ncbi:MAG: biotin/lipoyl-containing protein [Flavobacteriaceae bacterium]|nr:biotin/lipoyl-containing protein [Flavobacteriaceae bacterium]
MSTTYKLLVNQSHSILLNSQDVQNLDVSKNHLLFNSESIDIEWLERDFNQKTYRFKLNGETFEVQIQDALDLLIENLGLGVASAHEASDVIAPMPGRIVLVSVSEGQQVKQGDPLLTLEAMKMENTLVAKGDGVVKDIKVSIGDTVSKLQLLIEMA